MFWAKTTTTKSINPYQIKIFTYDRRIVDIENYDHMIHGVLFVVHHTIDLLIVQFPLNYNQLAIHRLIAFCMFLFVHHAF